MSPQPTHYLLDSTHHSPKETRFNHKGPEGTVLVYPHNLVLFPALSNHGLWLAWFCLEYHLFTFKRTPLEGSNSSANLHTYRGRGGLELATRGVVLIQPGAFFLPRLQVPSQGVPLLWGHGHPDSMLPTASSVSSL